jgi:hypothetical protein
VKPDSDAVSFYVINPNSLVKSPALQQLAIYLMQFNVAITIFAETWFTTQHADLLVNSDGCELGH